MKARKLGAGAVFLGAVLTAMFGAGSAQAAPGISIDPGTNGKNPIGIGDYNKGGVETKTGANAVAKPGNTSVAVSIFSPTGATADASRGGTEKFGEGNNVVAIGSSAVTGEHSAGNNVVATGGAVVRVDGTHNNVLGVAGDTTVVKNAAGDNVVTVCGATVSGQAANIKASHGC